MSADPIDETWSKLSLKVANDPDALENWEALVSYVSRTVSKTSTPYQLEIFRTTYTQFLSKFPFLEQYWINYASSEFRLGFTENAVLVYQKALSIVPFSNIIWLHFLKLLKETVLNYNDLIYYYQEAESHIGLHYHSYQFWKDFLNVELSFNGKSIYYYNILRKVVQIPIFNFSYFFKILLKEIETLNGDSLLKLVDGTEILKKLKLDISKIDLKKQDFHDVKAKLKKLFTDVYITTQFRTFEIYQFERKISLEYFVPGIMKSFQEIANWESYLSYMELNGTPNQIRSLYERALVPTANYSNIWLKYSDYFLKIGESQSAINLLYKAMLFLPRSKALAAHIKLARLEIASGNFLKARDLVHLLLSAESDNLAVLFELINIEYLLSAGDIKGFQSLVTQLIDQKPPGIAVYLLEHLYQFKGVQLSVDALGALNSNGRFNSEVKYWLILLNTSLRSHTRQETKKVYKEALGYTNNDKKLLTWYEKYLTYESTGPEDLKEDFLLNSALAFKVN